MLRIAIFRVITQRGFLTLQDGTDRLSRNVSKVLPHVST